ncbi:SGNH/GDSL hydrolase family protein [Phytomonospora sp. NPDC050363]|uniref:SGNH/GDSL hydrolase family protein n=1 Tax=Phytomonospora sp. NPDC050363 TaxID=3155642 RepID=UPI0033C96E84
MPGTTTRRRLAGPTLVAALAVLAALLTASPAQAAGEQYVALGDSYSSGVGTREYLADDGCYRSKHAYPYKAAAEIGATLSFQACSGAKTADVLSKQLGTLSAETDLVTISIGGNDAGFSSVITQCAKPWPYTCTKEIAAANAFIRDTLPGRLDNVYEQIRSKAPNARVVVVGYPRLFNGETCNALARLSAGEQSELNKTADLLATTTKGRVTAHGYSFVDPRDPFEGHQVCDDTEWINGLSNPVIESYHPNRGGQTAYTGLVKPLLL